MTIIKGRSKYDVPYEQLLNMDQEYFRDHILDNLISKRMNCESIRPRRNCLCDGCLFEKKNVDFKSKIIIHTRDSLEKYYGYQGFATSIGLQRKKVLEQFNEKKIDIQNYIINKRLQTPDQVKMIVRLEVRKARDAFMKDMNRKPDYSFLEEQ